MLCVKAELISERLLSDIDKKYMLDGLVSIASLITFVKVWRDNGMPDYAHGKTETFADEKIRIKKGTFAHDVENNSDTVYRKPFIEHGIVD